MKKIFIFMSFVLSINANAKLGSWATYKGFITDNCGESKEEYTIKSTVIAWNEETNVSKVRTERLQDGSGLTSEYSGVFPEGEKLLDKNSVSSYCAMTTGSVEQIKLPRGMFWSCRITEVDQPGESRISWIGGAPLGLLAWEAKIVKFPDDPSCREKIREELLDFEF